ncbi:glycosyltransferase family 4 protein [Planctomycetota bacterium]
MIIVMDFRKYDGVFGGVEQVVTNIIKHGVRAGKRFVLLSKSSRIEELRELYKDQPAVKPMGLPVESHAISIKNAYLDTVTIQNIAEQENADLIHFPYNWSFPFGKKVATLLTIHDVIPFTFREAMGFFRNHFFYKPSLKLACRLNTMISTVSEFSRQDIEEKVGISAEKIKVVPNGLRTPGEPDEAMYQELKAKFQLDKGFILNVGGIHERKNIVRLIEAFAQFVGRTGYEGKLVITGSVSGAPYQEKMKKLCDGAAVQTKMTERVVFTGFITDAQLDLLFQEGHFLVYPSLYEGFGIPIVEAMNAGLPVITSEVTAMKDAAGDAALLIDPYDTEALAVAMVRLHDDQDLQKELAGRGKERARLYSWEKTAQGYMSLYQQLVGP